VVDRKSVDTALCTTSGKAYFTGLPNGIVLWVLCRWRGSDTQPVLYRNPTLV
jgi:hypothetical protein